MNNDYQQKANDYQPDSAARQETAPARQQDRVARQAVKPTYAQSAETPAPARRRRSDRDAQPREDAPQWVRQEPPAAPEADQQVYARRRPGLEGDGYEDTYARRSPALEDEDDYDQEPRGKLWVRALIVMLVIVLGLCAALYFLPDLGPLKGAQQSLRSAVQSVKDKISPTTPEITSFQIVTNSGTTGDRIFLQAAASRSVKGVRLEDIEGNEVPCTISRLSDEDPDTQLFGITVTFSQPFEGEVFAAYTDGQTWQRSSHWVMLSVAEPTPVPPPMPTETPAPTLAPADPTLAPATQAPAAQSGDNQIALNVWTASGTQTPTRDAGDAADPAAFGDGNNGADDGFADDETNADDGFADDGDAFAGNKKEGQAEALAAAAGVPVADGTEEPAAIPTEEPTEEPTEAPTEEPTQAPTATPMPRLSAQAAAGQDADAMKVTDTVYIGGKSQKNYAREEGYVAPNPDRYSYYDGGVFTFRGDNFRRNAAFGTVEVTAERLSVLWQAELGSLRTADNGTLYGVGWTGQPAIVKWTSEVRQMMNLYEEKKNTKALREVIFGAQDGKIYFLDLTDGTATRDPISVGYPLKGSVSVDTYGRPLIAVGQGISKLANGKTGSIGLHVYNLVSGKKAFLINGRKSDNQKQYTTNGAFDGTALFLYENDALVAAGENGLLYTVDLGSKFTYPNAENPDAQGALELKQSTTYLRTKGAGEKDALVSKESSVAMYDKYIYMADTYGLLQCVDSDTMTTVWAADMGDNTDASIALDMDGDTGVSLYTGNTAYSRLGTKKDVSICRLNALTGETIWEYNIKCQKSNDQLSGCKASPVIGEKGIDDLVVFTVNMLEGGGSRVIALKKDSGAVVWTFDMDSNAISSPVAVYNEAGKAWIIQGDEGGNLYLLDGQTGSLRNTLNLGGKIQGSPAVYKDILVIGTCSKDNAFMYGIQIQ